MCMSFITGSINISTYQSHYDLRTANSPTASRPMLREQVSG